MKKYIILSLYFLIINFTSYSQESNGRSKSFSFEETIMDFKLPKIWAVVIGVSKYEKTEMKLEFADKDAQFFYDYLTSPTGGSLLKENSSLLLNEKATRANILKEIVDKCNRAFDDDLFILYIAGHGMPDPVGNEVYFLTEVP